MVNPDLIASRDYYSKIDDETLTDSPEAHKPGDAGSGGRTSPDSPEAHKPAVSGGSFGWSDDHDSGSRRRKKTETHKLSVSKPSTDETLTESPETHKAVSKPEPPSDEETDFLKTSVSSKSILFESSEVRKPSVLLESPETRKGSTYELLEKKYSEMSYIELELEYHRVSKELEELKNRKDVSPYEWNAKVRELETIQREMEKKKPPEISFLETIKQGRKKIEESGIPSPFKSLAVGLYDAIMGVPSVVAGTIHEERARIELPSKKEEEFIKMEWEGFIETGKKGIEWAKENPIDALFYSVGFLAPVGISKGVKAVKGTTKSKIWYHDVVPEEGSPLSFEPLPKTEIAKTGGAKVEITKAGKRELTVFGEIKEVKPYTAKEVGGIIKTKSITGSKETIFVSRGSETVSITKESPSVIGKVLGKETKISVEKTKIIDTKPNIKENVRYFKEEGGGIVEKPQFEREGISKGGLTKELIEKKETITRVPKEFTEVRKEVDFSVPKIIPTVLNPALTRREPKFAEMPDKILKSVPRMLNSPEIVNGENIIPKVEPQSMKDVLNDVFTATSLGTGILTRTATRTTTKQVTKQRTRQRSKTIVDVGIPRIRPPKPKIPTVRDKSSIFGISKRKKGKVKEGFRLNIYASAKEIIGGLGVFKENKKVSKGTKGSKKNKRGNRGGKGGKRR